MSSAYSGQPEPSAAQRTTVSAAAPPAPLHRRPMLYPNVYVWYVFLASLDLMLTWIVLHLDGFELNPLADRVIQYGGLPATAVYKFALVVVVILVCEIVGRHSDRIGRRLAEWAVAVTAVPVALAFIQLARDLLAQGSE